MLAGYHGDECAAVPRRPAPRRRGSTSTTTARRLESRRKRKGARNGTSTTTTRAKSFHVRRPVRQSDLVFWGTHNSYHRRPRRFHFPYWNALIPQWQYSHPRLARQLDAGARHLELDVHVDSATRKALVYHVQSLDSRTRCYCLRDCLGSLVDWSRRRSGDHGLVVVLLEVKGTKSYVEDVASRAAKESEIPNFKGSRRTSGLGDDRYPESRDALRVIDDTIFDAFAPTPHSLLTPDDVAGDYASPGASVRDRGWPAADALRGAFAFALLDSSQEAQLTRAYDASRRPRAMFTMGSAVVGRDAAAIYKYDNPNNPDHFAAIQAAVRAGFLVRTRANTVKYVANYARFAKARESGAQLVSFEADAKSNWLRFVGNPASQCACDALALAGPTATDDAEPARTRKKLRFWHEVLPAISVAAVPAVPLLPMSAKRAREQMSATAPSNEVRALLRFAFSAAAEGLGITLVGGQSIGDGYVYARADGAPFADDDLQPLRTLLPLAFVGDVACVDVPWYKLADYFRSKGLARSAALIAGRDDAIPCLQADVKDARVWRLRLGALARDGALEAGLRGVRAADWNPSSNASARASPCATAPPCRRRCAPRSPTARPGARASACGRWATSTLEGRAAVDYALQAEFRQEAKIHDLARAVAARRGVGLICIAGPTSSGKTAFAAKLGMYLRNEGVDTVGLTVDHYYLPLDRQPKYQKRKQRSDVDYDAVESMDGPLVGDHINALLRGERVEPPVYDMKTGYRDGVHAAVALPAGSVLIIEGIHALNPEFVGKVPRDRTFKVFISPLPALGLDECNALKTTDCRLLRRMCRDFKFGATASKALRHVRRRPPHQDDVDFAMNSATEYELRVLKPVVEPLLRDVPPASPHGQGRRSRVPRAREAPRRVPADVRPSSASSSATAPSTATEERVDGAT
ncbi:calcium dependent phosphoinositide phospholipase C [Aureococcus anophagefferens]|nr:calcium dependent phosphoinositide phospholipase C [Aureococcus anophagefferens]